jgi:hypothetical protein
MNRGQAERAVAESNLPATDVLILMMLLRRAHNDTLAVPDWRTPTLPQLAQECRASVRTLRRRLPHLEQHGWVKRSAGTGRGRKSAYTMLPQPVPCDCPHKRKAPTTDAERAHRYRQRKGDSSRDTETVKGVNPRDEKGTTSRTEPQVTTDIAPRAHQGGRVNKGALPPDWSLIRQIVRIVNDDPCGGIHRDELAEKLHMPPGSKALGQALAIATRRRQIDWCGRYAVKVIPKEKWPT